MNLTLTIDREEDGRWIVEVRELPGVMTYGTTREDALAKAEVLALRVLADRIEHAEAKPVPISIVLPACVVRARSRALSRATAHRLVD